MVNMDYTRLGPILDGGSSEEERTAPPKRKIPRRRCLMYREREVVICSWLSSPRMVYEKILRAYGSRRLYEAKDRGGEKKGKGCQGQWLITGKNGSRLADSRAGIAGCVAVCVCVCVKRRETM
jgi:hypothetical protein